MSSGSARRLECNFPVDPQSRSYAVLWNALKRFAAGYSESEKHALFAGTACRVYRIEMAPGGVD